MEKEKEKNIWREKNWTAEENREGIGGKYLRKCNLPFQMLDVRRQRLAKTAELVLDCVS